MGLQLVHDYCQQYDDLRGFDGSHVIACVSEELSIRYPLLLRKGEGRLIIEVTRQLFPALDELRQLPVDVNLPEAMAVVFDSGLHFDEDVSYMAALRAADLEPEPLPAGVDVDVLEGREYKRAFQALLKACPRQDRQLAQVSLNDDKVVGVIVKQELVSVASGLRWGETQLRDIGVVTHPAHRGKGYGKVAVQALAAAYARENPLLQYRADESNPASVRIMRALGFQTVYTLSGAIVRFSGGE